jgi:AhpD family alkylhydroperoxidase
LLKEGKILVANEDIKDLKIQMHKLTKELPEVMNSFNQLHEKVIVDGTISAKQKELIAIGISVAIRCTHCMVFHITSAVKLGATRQEILEAISVAILMGGGPATAYSTDALKILDSLTSEK